MENTKIASWARSMAQLMEQKKVTQSDVDMIIDAYELPRDEETELWYQSI